MESYFHDGVILTGTLRIRGSMHFEGDFQGEIYSEDHFIVGKLGNVSGKIIVHDFTNMGRVKGNVRAEGKVSLIAGSDLSGDITTNQLEVDDEVNFEGHCKMLNRKRSSKSKAKKRGIREIPMQVIESERPSELSEDSTPELASSESISTGSGFKRKFFTGKKISAIAALIIVLVGGYYIYPKFLAGGLEGNIARGYEFINQKKYSDAESEFQNALTSSRNNPKVYAGLGEVYLQKKKFNEAMAHFLRAIELSPSESSYHLKLAQAYTAEGHIDESMKSYKTVLELDSESYEAYFHIGVLRLNEGARTDGIESLEMSAKLNPEYYLPHKTLGELYATEGENQKALEEIREAIRLKADDADLYLALGELLSAENNQSEAVSAFEKVVQLSPQKVKAQVFMANWHFQRGENDQALKYFVNAEAIEPRNSEVQARLGKLYSENNDFQKAKVAFKNAVKLNPQDDDSLYNLGVLLAEKKDYFQAQGALESAVSLNDKHADAFLELGKVLIEIGDGKDAEAKMKTAFKLNPGSTSSYFLAKAQTTQKKYDRAVQTLQRAVRKDSSNHILQYGLCDTYYHKRLFTTAINHCEKALKLDPGYPHTLSRLAWLYAKKKKSLDKALAFARDALVSDPANTDFLSSLAEVYFSLGEVGLAKETISSAIEIEPDFDGYKKQMQKFDSAN